MECALRLVCWEMCGHAQEVLGCDSDVVADLHDMLLGSDVELALRAREFNRVYTDGIRAWARECTNHSTIIN